MKQLTWAFSDVKSQFYFLIRWVLTVKAPQIYKGYEQPEKERVNFKLIF